MRKTVVHRLDVLHIGGIQEMVFNLYKASSHDHKWWVMVGGGEFEAEMRSAGMEIYIGAPPPGMDVLVGHTVGGWSYNETFAEQRRRGVKTIECMHSIADSQTSPGLVDAFVAVSELAAERNSARFNAITIYPPINVEAFRVRKRTGTHPQQPVIGRLSRLAPEKRPLEFVEIARRLPEYRFVIAGGGPLLERVRLSAPPNLEVVGWVRDFPEWYAGIDLFVFPTADECCCVSVAMAQAAGVPVICQNIAPLVETTGGGAIFCHHIDDFVTSIRRVLSGSAWATAENMAGRARSFVCERFSLSGTVSAWDDLVDRLTGGNSNA